jgi:hypothetical protein
MAYSPPIVVKDLGTRTERGTQQQSINEFCFDTFIKKPVKNYGHAAGKVNLIIVTGTYRHEKMYTALEEKKKQKKPRRVDSPLN